MATGAETCTFIVPEAQVRSLRQKYMFQKHAFLVKKKNGLDPVTSLGALFPRFALRLCGAHSQVDLAMFALQNRGRGCREVADQEFYANVHFLENVFFDKTD